LERLNDDDLTTDQLEKEIGRSKAIGSVAQNIISNANLSLNAEKFKAEYGLEKQDVSQLLDSGD
ncbi:hypothetical protein CVR96_27905, partial [Salmonella enterica subsp. enterica serovar Typhimurium]|uniref:hypothetical protein n=1 Tax=Salmonella enterica TaxID=28901 RepID=UPI000C22A847